MTLREVESRHDISCFHSVGKAIYRNNSNWVPSPASEIEAIFSSQTNAALRNGGAKRFILLDDDMEPIGRIAAFYNSETARKEGRIVGGIGFYECIDDSVASEMLFHAAEAWLRAEGMTHVDAPVNFGERHQFYGLLVDGYDYPQVYQENYNPAFYEAHFSVRGYVGLFDSLTYVVKRSALRPECLERLHGYLSLRHTWTFRMFDKELAEEYIEDYLSIAREAFNLKNRTVRIDASTIQRQLNIQMNLINPSFIWFAYSGGRPVGVVAHMLNYNDLFHGSFRYIHSLKSFLIAVVPEFRNKGLAAALCWHSMKEMLNDEKIGAAHICGIASFSDNIRKILLKLGASRTTVHRIYRKTLIRTTSNAPVVR